MKRLIALMIMLTFVVGVPSAVFANGEDIKNASQWCTANDDLNLKNHGSCVSLVRACEGPGNTGPVCSCKEFLYRIPSAFYTEYNNLGECISHFQQGYVAE